MGVQFNVKVTVKDSDTGIARRARDLSPAFEEIVDQWVYGNQAKFEAAEGGETGGVEFSTATWLGVTPKYYRQKHGPILRGSRQLYADWLMKATGQLMETMTDKDSIQRAVTATAVAFGMPANDEAAEKVLGNLSRREVIFLSEDEMAQDGMIVSIINSYLGATGKFAGYAEPHEFEASGGPGFDMGGQL